MVYQLKNRWTTVFQEKIHNLIGKKLNYFFLLVTIKFYVYTFAFDIVLFVLLLAYMYKYKVL